MAAAMQGKQTSEGWPDWAEEAEVQVDVLVGPSRSYEVRLDDTLDKSDAFETTIVDKTRERYDYMVTFWHL